MDAAAIFPAATLQAPPPRKPEPQPLVEQPAAATAVSADRSRSPAENGTSRGDDRAETESSFERDDATDSLVYRLVDLSTGIVTIQTPNDARLRLRAYIDGVIANSDSGLAVRKTA